MANSASVNGSGAGTATASLHALPSKYTLVLIDGVRPPQSAINNSFGGGFAASINGIPLDAVQRVEILLDGATAVYGSDAIAGVVNFILKKNSTEGNAYAQYTWPTKGAANGVEAGVSKGWGDLAKDGWNVMGTFGYNHQDKLQATDRKFSAQGAYFPFTAQRRELHFQQPRLTTPSRRTSRSMACRPQIRRQRRSLIRSIRTTGESATAARRPAGVISDPTGTGSLGAIGESCRFNYAATVQDIPPSDTLELCRQGLPQARRQRDRVGHDQPVAIQDDAAICAAGAAVRPQYHDTDAGAVQQVCRPDSGCQSPGHRQPGSDRP